MLLQVSNGTKDFAGEILFENIHFEIKENRKIAVIGRNGCGKTTLLKVISGLLPLDGGTINKGNDVSVGYLSQMAFSNEELTVEEEFNRVYEDLLKIRDEMEMIGKKLETEYDNEALLRKYASLQHAFEAGNGYNYNQEQIILFTKFGFSLEDLNRPLSTFSGGQKTRIALRPATQSPWNSCVKPVRPTTKRIKRTNTRQSALHRRAAGSFCIPSQR